VSLASQFAGTALGIVIALAGGFAITGRFGATVGIRLDAEQEFRGGGHLDPPDHLHAERGESEDRG